MIESQTLIERRKIGAYETPQKTAEYMAHQLQSVIKSGGKILDPAAGQGVFLRSLIQSGVSPESIYAWDTDPDVLPDLQKLTPHAFLKDALIPDSLCFDAIIANPPYISHESEYVHLHREMLRKEYKEIGVYNLYALFAVASIRRLREGRTACLLLLDSFLTNRYHFRFRKYLLENCKIKEILLAPRKLFHSGKADVRTVILTVEKCSDPELRNKSRMHLVDRVTREEEYSQPKREEYRLQESYLESEESRFHICVPQSVLNIINHPMARISDVMDGGAGISTGRDERFLRLSNEVGSDPDWVPFYKNNGGRAYLAESLLRIHRDWKKDKSNHLNYMARNSRFYFHEGISCSSMGVRFSACYLPKGCLFGVNANLFLKKNRPPQDLFYVLGFLNSKLCLYMIRAVLNRTNMVTPGYVKELPFIEPSPESRNRVILSVSAILNRLRLDPNANSNEWQRQIDQDIFEIYNIPQIDQEIITDFCENILEKI